MTGPEPLDPGRVHEAAIVVDLHAHPSMKTYFGKRRMARREKAAPGFNPFGLRTSHASLVAGGVDVLCSCVYVPEAELAKDCVVFKLGGLFIPALRHALRDPPAQVALAMLRHVEEQVDEVNAGNPARALQVVRSKAELDQAVRAGRIALVHTVEGAHVLERDPANVRRFRDRGVAMITLAHFYENGVAPPVDSVPDDFFLKRLGCFRRPKDLSLGLPPLGRQVVEAMFDAGVVVDLTHCTANARRDVYGLPNPRRRPLVMSHVGAAALMDHPMNPTDDEVRRIADTGGVVGVIFYRQWLFPRTPRRPDRLANVVETVRHLVNVGGTGCVALGSDFDGMTDPPDDLREPADLPKLTAALLQGGFAPTEIEAVLGKNFLRVLAAGWG